MKRKSKTLRRTAVFLASVGLVGIMPRLIWAIPSLQLYIDPDDNIGTGYDSVTETWFYQGSAPHIELDAFALDKNLGSPEGNAFAGTDTTGQLAIALRGAGLDAGSDSSTFGSIDIDGNVINTWTFGTPPDSGVPGGDLPSHGIFPSWYAVYSFSFGSFGAPVFDTKPPVESVVWKLGWHKLLQINFAGLDNDIVENAHFDAFTFASDGSVHASNSFSHDAEVNLLTATGRSGNPPVPEPATLALLVVGLAGFALRRKTGVDVMV